MLDKALTIDQHWKNWIEDKDAFAADRLVEHYLYLVDYHTNRIASHLPKNVLKDDIRSLGLFGLYDALQKFEPERDLKFDTYASFRIRGAIIDGLRKEDWLPRSTREKAKKIDQASHELIQKLQRNPSVTEVAEHLNMKVSEVETSYKDAWSAHLLSIEEKVGESSEDHKEGIGYTIVDKDQLSPEDKILKDENYEELAQSIKQLNQNEQMVISLFYHEELTFTEIGHVLSLTTSRISQIHKQAIFKLKHVLS
ncbi:FliA/WhiG family RNA polymerase sigma factor [Amphibacillus jilinensis]|uniref:FliA/WhiG family RNA polymerase sigma factor n=1 Tax=Amphibacillus jilinensis TaxID=1216008 RepID=UPI0002F13243|nr:FliA/WhiG family RNA polymerase sigma factor [Amphibacillus jilinensis]